jgi:hypothetical protein
MTMGKFLDRSIVLMAFFISATNILASGLNIAVSAPDHWRGALWIAASLSALSWVIIGISFAVKGVK